MKKVKSVPNNDILSTVWDFKREFPMKDWDGDGQEFFETIDECALLEFFEKLYGLK